MGNEVNILTAVSRVTWALAVDAGMNKGSIANDKNSNEKNRYEINYTENEFKNFETYGTAELNYLKKYSHIWLYLLTRVSDSSFRGIASINLCVDVEVPTIARKLVMFHTMLLYFIMKGLRQFDKPLRRIFLRYQFCKFDLTLQIYQSIRSPYLSIFKKPQKSKIPNFIPYAEKFCWIEKCMNFFFELTMREYSFSAVSVYLMMPLEKSDNLYETYLRQLKMILYPIFGNKFAHVGACIDEGKNFY